MLKGERENIGYLFCQKSERCAVRGLTSGIWNLASDIRYQISACCTEYCSVEFVDESGRNIRGTGRHALLGVSHKGLRGVVDDPPVDQDPVDRLSITFEQRSRGCWPCMHPDRPRGPGEVPFWWREGRPLPVDQRHASSVVNDEVPRYSIGVGYDRIVCKGRIEALCGLDEVLGDSHPRSISVEPSERGLEIDRDPRLVDSALQIRQQRLVSLMQLTKNLAGGPSETGILRKRLEVPLAGVSEYDPMEILRGT